MVTNQIIDLRDMKKYLKVEDDWEDTLIEGLIVQAQSAAEAYCRTEFSYDNAPEAVRLAVTLMAAFYYEKRTGYSESDWKAMRMSFENLLSPHADPEKLF